MHAYCAKSELKKNEFTAFYAIELSTVELELWECTWPPGPPDIIPLPFQNHHIMNLLCTYTFLHDMKPHSLTWVRATTTRKTRSPKRHQLMPEMDVWRWRSPICDANLVLN